MTLRAGSRAEEARNPLESLLIIRALELLGHRQPSIAEREIKIVDALAAGDRNVLLFLRSVQDDLMFGLGELVPRHIRSHPKLSDNVGLDVKSEHVPRNHSPVVNAQGGIGHQCGVIDLADHARALALRAGTL